MSERRLKPGRTFGRDAIMRRADRAAPSVPPSPGSPVEAWEKYWGVANFVARDRLRRGEHLPKLKPTPQRGANGWNGRCGRDDGPKATFSDATWRKRSQHYRHRHSFGPSSASSVATALRYRLYGAHTNAP